MRGFLLVLLLALPPGVAFAQPDEDSLFSSRGSAGEAQPDADPADEASLFGGEGENSLFSEIENDPAASPADDLLTSETVTVGGSFGVSFEGRLDLGEAAFSSGVADLRTQLFVDARPSLDLRVLAKGDLGYSTARGAAFALTELFADATVNNIVNDTVFLRAGKQTINWGVGYFYSPANLINVARVDPENPEAELAGPVALRAQLPLGTDNLTGYLIADDLAEGLNVSAAARYDFLVSSFEVTTGGVVEAGGHWAVMGTATGTVAGVTLFGEAVLEGGSDKVFVVEDESSPSGLGTATSDTLFFSGTLGGRYSYETDDERFSLSATAQYFFNGPGYADSSVFTDDPDAVTALVGAGRVRPSDLQERGQHYLGLSVSSPDVADLSLTPSALWLANLSDGSGLVNVGLTYDLNDIITPRVEYRYRYGPVGTEYASEGQGNNLTLALDLMGVF